MMAELKNKEHYRKILCLLIPLGGVAFLLWYIKNSTCDVVYSDYIRLVNSYLPDVYDPRRFFVPDVLTRIPINYLERIINVELFGFSTENELNCFQLLTSVSGVGPKAALSILSAATPESLAMSIITGDEKALTVAQGIGKKIAQRIILELKDKLAKGQIAPGGESYGGTGVTVIPENKSSEAAAALAVLGYSQSEIAAALKGIDVDGLALEEIIKQALKRMVKN